jgi:hypothetical protein
MRVRYRALAFFTFADRLELELLYLNIVWTHNARALGDRQCSWDLVFVRPLWVMDETDARKRKPESPGGVYTNAKAEDVRTERDQRASQIVAGELGYKVTCTRKEQNQHGWQWAPQDHHWETMLSPQPR